MTLLDIVMKFARHKENKCKISELPEELIQWIFCQYVSGSSFASTPTEPTIRHSSQCDADIVKLLHINRAWRRVALDTRDIWSSIYLFNPSEKVLAKFDAWFLIVEKLVRKKDALINLQLESSNGCMTELALHKIFGILDQVRDLELILPWCTVDMFSTADNGGLIKLLWQLMAAHPTAPVERIHIWLSDDIEVRRRENLLDLWQCMLRLPNIQHILWDYKSRALPDPPTWEAHRLRSLEVREMIYFDMHWILTACPALEEFRVLDHLFLDTRRPKMQPLEHSCLKALSLSGIDILPALDPYTFPALEKIYISYCKGAAKFRYMIAFIQRCKPHITHYTFAQRRDMILGNEDHNVLHLDLCRKYFNGTLEHFALRDTLTKEVVNMLMQRLPDGTHRYIPIVKTLDIAVDGLGGGIVSDLVFSRAAVYRTPLKQYQLMKGTGGEVVQFTLRRNEPYGLGDQRRMAAMEREKVVIRRLSNVLT
ncbi:hypothetical protein CPC08DRAFT_716113 [Agrocybe pediades]|nr:hypothetical protein CPC08DRAFT_716113 [Agrocybe pediades]